MRKLWNMLRYGSSDGPKMIINWEKRSVTFLNCSGKMVTRRMRHITFSDESKRPLKWYINDDSGVS